MQKEKIVWSGTPSQLINTRCYIFCGLFSWLLIPLVIMIFEYLKIKTTKFELTSQRLLIRTGILNKKTEQIELYRVKDIHLDEPFIMRLFKLGNLKIETSDKEFPEKILPAMSNPEVLKDEIRNLVESLRISRNVRELDFGL